MRIPEDLIHQIAKGQVVAFVGAGLSQGAKLPGWKQLLKQMLDWGKKNGVELDDQQELQNCIDAGDLLLVAEELRESFGIVAFHEFMVNVFRMKKYQPTLAHKLLPRLPFSAVLTSNYDKLIESTYEKANEFSSVHVFTHADTAELSMALRSGEFYILKIHGTIDRIDTLILGTTDYRKVMHHNPAYHQHLAYLFSTKTLLFLGVGLSDPDLRLVLDELRATFKEHTTKHYALMSNEDISPLKQRRFLKDYGIHILSYTPSTQPHLVVQGFLKALVEKVGRISESYASTRQETMLLQQMEELKRSHALLSRDEKFSSLRHLASRLAHEIQNPMTALGKFIQMLPMKYDDEQFRQDFYKIAMEETMRVNNLITELLDLVKTRESYFELADLHNIIDEMLYLLSPKIAIKKITIVSNYARDIKKIKLDTEKIKQAILNILDNAMEFTPDGGEIMITTSTTKDSEEKSYIRIKIEDNGPGIPQSIISKIFDPYFTTKYKSHMHHGAGLGLFIVYQNMRDHGGSVEAKSKVNEGASFVLTLPNQPVSDGQTG